MISKFSNYIVESKKSIDHLETLTPDQLGKLLLAEVKKYFPDFQYIQDILAVGCPIDARDSAGWTALHWAVQLKQLKIAEYLLDMGADIHARNNDGWTPLHKAAYAESIEEMQLLLSRGADVDVGDEDNFTPLHIAAHYIKFKSINMLLNSGADIDIKNNKGKTPRMIMKKAKLELN